MSLVSVALTFLMLCLVSPALSSDVTEIDPALGCSTNPAIVGKCFPLRARVSVTNGTPSVRVWPVGSKRVLGVMPAEHEIMPSNLREVVGLDQDVFADLEVCPFSLKQKGEMQFVCIESAKHLRVQKRAAGTSSKKPSKPSK